MLMLQEKKPLSPSDERTQTVEATAVQQPGGGDLLRPEHKPAGTFLWMVRLVPKETPPVHHYHVDNCNWGESAKSSSSSAGVETHLHVS